MQLPPSTFAPLFLNGAVPTSVPLPEPPTPLHKPSVTWTLHTQLAGFNKDYLLHEASPGAPLCVPTVPYADLNHKFGGATKFPADLFIRQNTDFWTQGF